MFSVQTPFSGPFILCCARAQYGNKQYVDINHKCRCNKYSPNIYHVKIFTINASPNRKTSVTNFSKMHEMQDVWANVSLSLQIHNVIDGTVELSIHLITPVSAFLCCPNLSINWWFVISSPWLTETGLIINRGHYGCSYTLVNKKSRGNPNHQSKWKYW